MMLSPSFWIILEWVAVVVGIISSIGAYRRAMWNWPWGLAYSLLAGWLVWHLQLYAALGLQAFYFVSGVLGWWNWKWGGPRHDGLPVSSLGWHQRAGIAAGCLLAAAVSGTILRSTSNASEPFWDSLITVSAMAAALLCVQKKIECWTAWSVSTVLAAGLFFSKEAYAMAAVSAAYFVFNCFAHRAWRREMKRAGEEVPQETEMGTPAPTPG